MITTLAWVVLLTALTRPLRQGLRHESTRREPLKPDAVFEDKAEFAGFAGPAGAQPLFWEFRDFGELCKARGAGIRGKPVSRSLSPERRHHLAGEQIDRMQRFVDRHVAEGEP